MIPNLPENFDSEDFRPSRLPPGVYKFTVDQAEERDSQNNNPMIALQLKIVSGPNGETTAKDSATGQDVDISGANLTVRDSLVFKLDSRGCKYKIQQFRKSVGITGQMPSATDLVGKTSLVRLELKPSRQDPSKKYLEVADYLTA